MVLLIDAPLRHIDLVDGFSGWIDYLCSERCLANAQTILVDVSYEPATLINGHVGVLFAHVGLRIVPNYR